MYRPIPTTHQTHMHLIERSSHNSTHRRIKERAQNPLYNTHTTSLGRKPPPSSLPQHYIKQKVPSQRERKEERSKTPGAATLSFKGKPAQGAHADLYSQNTKRDGCSHARTTQKKHYAQYMPALPFFTRPSLALGIFVVPGDGGGQGSSIPLGHRVGETFYARFG